MIVQRTTQLREGGVENVTFSPVSGLGNDDDAVNVVRPFNVRSLTKTFELMTPNSSGSHHDWKSWEHYKRVYELPRGDAPLHPTTQFTEHAGYLGSWYHKGEHQDQVYGYYGYGEPDYPIDGLQVMYDTGYADSGSLIPAPVDLDKLTQRALSNMLPSVKSELSLLNSLIELKDFKSIGRTITRIRDVGKSLSRSNLRRSLRDLLGAQSDGFLQLKFNLLPLLSDISGISTAIRTHVARVNELVASSAKAQRKHFTVFLDEQKDSDDRLGPIGYPAGFMPVSVAGTLFAFRQVRSFPSKFHAMIEYNFSFTQYQRENAHALALLDALGVNLNPSIIWNALPWSFVVDWVLGVGRWLDQYTIANMEPVINIRRYSWSISRKRQIASQYQLGRNSFGYAYSGTIPAGVIYETAYRRHVGLPSRSSIISSGLSSSEFSLGAALVLSRRRRHKQKR